MFADKIIVEKSIFALLGFCILEEFFLKVSIKVYDALFLHHHISLIFLYLESPAELTMQLVLPEIYIFTDLS